MTTATQTTPATDLADRFRCESDVPDPPRDAAGRKQYWEDTVAEAVAELRRRLASTRDEKSFQALQMIVDLEKTRLRHKAPVAGTEVGSRRSSGLGSMENSTSSGGKYEGPKKSEPEASATVLPNAPSLTPPARTGPDAPSLALPARTEPEASLPSYPFPPKPLRPIPMRERVKLQDGIHGHFHDHDDDWMLEPGRGRRARATRAARAAAEVVEVAIPLVFPPPLPRPAVKNFDLFSPRPDAVLGEPAA